MKRRGSGILLHVTSLPSRFGVGDFGPAARRFIDFCSRSAQSYWQILPLTPTSTFIGNSPYSGDSAFALNPVLISPEKLVEDGYLDPGEIEGYIQEDPTRAEYDKAEAFKLGLLRTAFARRRAGLDADPAFAAFVAENAFWLDEYALFRAIKGERGGQEWTGWPRELRLRDPEALAEVRRHWAEDILFVAFVQYLLAGQWQDLRRHASKKNILIIGDAPIYVTLDSADVWSNQGLFKLDPDGQPLFVAGVPPDYFSETGQRWGNPVYDWPAHEATRFAWWMRRMDYAFRLYDFIRLDHFRGFEAYWEIPASEKTAVAGQWVKAPGEALFKELLHRFPTLPIIAEDLGVITAEVRELKDRFGFPGMKILQFAFGPGIAANRDAPHNHEPGAVVYTGTHDNTTTRDWFVSEAGEAGKRILFDYLGREMDPDEVPWAMIRLAMMSVCSTAILPMQDLLGLGEQGRMNRPSVAKGNWSWRVTEDRLSEDLAARLAYLTGIYGRNH
ncbi:4-alpha-glucanotransferase [Desulfolutivibrio sulfoxidireducens]|uniref:4-alpha-glucanotransferase n=1 Tax=Desulfolutivibrio sulfoxidireducens TaxID=2773299 RepID=UPI00159E6117|nr:4-alpha-glucanotransferase [Desulfolutivibrio sulfoxidireducens]QLA15095.1 4-alpha-glucanotransferase [Desulfolutivibrio sulfoxidireducens]